MLGLRLGAAGAGYTEVDRPGQTMRIRHDWHAPGVPPLPFDSIDLRKMGERALADFAAGRTYVAEDGLADAAIPPAGRLPLERAGSRGLLAEPLILDGRLVALVYVHADGPRRWTGTEIALLRAAARRTFDTVARLRYEAALRESESRLRLATEAANLGTWEFDLEAGTGRRSVHLSQSFAARSGDVYHLAEWLDGIHPEDAGRMITLTGAVRDGTAPRFDEEYRIRRPDGGWAWLRSTGAVVERAANGAPRRLAGVVQDVTERRTAEERRTLLMREVDHRAKNALSVVQAALRLTRAETIEEYREAIDGRVAAMARAQTLLSEDRWAGADLRALLTGEVAPFLGGEPARATLDGPAVNLPAGAAQPLAMALHELSANAARHGALSRAGGDVRLSWRVDPGEELSLRWSERGGPAVEGPPARRGFGARMIEGTVRGQLRGRLALDWARSGLVCDIAMPLRVPSLPGG